MRESAEVVVVGGGIIGCAIASELARAGVDVLLLERAEIASAASGRNHGLIFYPQNETTGGLYRASHQIYRRLQQTSEVDFALDDAPRGFIILVESDDEWLAAEREAKASSAGGLDIERLDERDLRKLEPEISKDYVGGWFIDDGYRCDPAALTLALALEARRDGADVVTHVDVKQVVTREGRVKGVATDDGVVTADTVVVASGPWSAKLLRTVGIDAPIVGARGWLLLTRAIPPLLNHLVESSGWHLIGEDAGPPLVSLGGFARGEHPASPDVGLLIQQNRSGHVLLGGSRLASTREDPEGHEASLEIARRAVRAIPKLTNVPLIAAWSGVRPMTPDGVPVIGWISQVEGLFIASGHGGQGVILGGGTGQLAAELLRGAIPFIRPDAFDPGRFSIEGGIAR